jgi:hypothetical protein
MAADQMPEVASEASILPRLFVLVTLLRGTGRLGSCLGR